MDGASGERRMMRGDDDRPGKIFGLDALQCGGEEVDLARVERLVGSTLVGDDAGIFEHVAVEAKDTDEGASKVK